MIRKIVLTNFMAHALTEIHLADGLNVLVGPNNIGKSTVALALKILARNANSNFVLQHDQKHCSVSVETSEGHVIDWIKRKSPSYVINGQAKDRLGRGGSPPELDTTLRLAPVEFEDRDFEPHFGDQKSPIFLINRPASQIAQFFSTTSDAEKLVAMQRLHQRNRNESQTQAKWLQQKNESIQHCMEALQSVPDLEREFISLEEEAKNLESLATEISQLEKLISHLAQLTLEQHIQMQRVHCLKALLPTPTIHPTEHLASVIANWEGACDNERFYGESLERLASLITPPKLDDEKPLAHMTRSLESAHAKFDYFCEQRQVQSELTAPGPMNSTDELQKVIQRIQSLEREQQRLQEIAFASANLTAFPALLPDTALSNAVQQLTHASNDFAIQKEITDLLSSLEATPIATETESLAKSIHDFEFSASQFKKNQELLQQVNLAVVELECETKNWLSTEPTCEACGSVLSEDSIRFKLHQHGIPTR